MANYANLKATINANIKANGTEAITGPVLNSVLTAAVNTLGAGYQFMGVATTSTSPGTPDANVFYIAATPGTYTNFGGLTVADGEVAILKYNGSWTKEVTGAATAAQVTQLGQEVNGFFPSLGQGYATGYSGSVVIDSTYQNRVISCVLEGNYTIKTKEGYVIRGVCAWNGGNKKLGDVPDDSFNVSNGTNLVSAGSLTSFVKNDSRTYSIVTFCKTDASANLTPEDDIIDSFVSSYSDGLKKKVEVSFEEISEISSEVYGFPFPAKGQGYCVIGDNWVAFESLPNRIFSAVLAGNYVITTKQGYVIRGVTEWNGGTLREGDLPSTPTQFLVTNGANPVTGGALTSYTKYDNYEYSVITFCKTDASANISPGEDVIDTINSRQEKVGLIERVEKLETEIQNEHSIKKAVFMGDSITQGVYSYWHDNVHTDENRYNGFDITNMSSVEESTAYHGIHYYFAKLAGCEIVNLGKRGTGWVVDTRNLGNALVVATNYSFSDVDFVALFFGVNDYIQGANIGTIGTPGTVRGNIASVLQKITTDNPLCKIVVYSPYNTFGQVSKGGDYTADFLYGDESTNYALGYDIRGKGTLSDYISAIDDVCNFYGVQHVKLSASNIVNRLTIKNIMIDGLHPSKESYPMLAAEIYGKGNFGA